MYFRNHKGRLFLHCFSIFSHNFVVVQFQIDLRIYVLELLRGNVARMMCGVVEITVDRNALKAAFSHLRIWWVWHGNCCSPAAYAGAN